MICFQLQEELSVAEEEMVLWWWFQQFQRASSLPAVLDLTLQIHQEDGQIMDKVLVFLIQVFRALRKVSSFFTVIQIGKEGKKKDTWWLQYKRILNTPNKEVCSGQSSQAFELTTTKVQLLIGCLN